MKARRRSPGQLDAELAILRSYQAAGTARQRQALLAKLLLVGEWLPQVRDVARAWHSAVLPQEDLVQAGVMGLLEAAARFDPDRPAGSPPRAGYGWVNYAYAYIRERIADLSRKQGLIVRETANEIRKRKALGLPRRPAGWAPLDAAA